MRIFHPLGDTRDVGSSTLVQKQRGRWAGVWRLGGGAQAELTSVPLRGAKRLLCTLIHRSTNIHFSVSWVQAQCDQIPHISTAKNSCHSGLWANIKIPSFKLLFFSFSEIFILLSCIESQASQSLLIKDNFICVKKKSPEAEAAKLWMSQTVQRWRIKKTREGTIYLEFSCWPEGESHCGEGALEKEKQLLKGSLERVLGKTCLEKWEREKRKRYTFFWIIQKSRKNAF